MPRKLHSCPAPCCQVLIPTHLLMCKMHWAEVPGKVKRDVTIAYRIMCDNGRPDMERQVAKVAHANARREAVSFLAQKFLKENPA